MTVHPREARIVRAEDKLRAVVVEAMRQSWRGAGLVAAAADPDGVPAAWAEAADGLVMPAIEQIFQDAVGAEVTTLAPPTSLDLLGALGPSFAANTRDAYVAGYLSSVRGRIVGIGESTWRQLAAEIGRGIELGESVPALSARVEAALGVAEARATVIARTESAGAINAGDHAVHRELARAGFTVTRRWLATSDERTRPEHRAADGQARGVDEPFLVGSASLRWPGDPLGPPEQTISCRCTTLVDLS